MKRQRSSSIDSSGDEVPKHGKKEKRGEKKQYHSGLKICRVDEGVLDRHHKVQPQLIKDLRVLHNFKEVNGKKKPCNCFMMDLRLASLNGRGLRAGSRRSHLFLYLERRGIDICCLQETRFDSNFHEDILSKDYLSFSAYFDGRSRGVTWLISRRLDATCALVLSDPAGRLCVVDVTIKDKAFRLIGVYGPNACSELPAFFRRIEPYVIPSKRVILVGDWNAVLDPNLDRGAISAGTNTLDARYFREFVQRLDLVDKFRERHPNKLAWTWTGRGASAQLYSYLDRVLVKRVDLDYLGGPSFNAYKDSDYKFLCVSIRLDKARCRMSSYWKFNSSLLAEADFRNQLELMVKRELTGAIMGNRWWANHLLSRVPACFESSLSAADRSL